MPEPDWEITTSLSYMELEVIVTALAFCLMVDPDHQAATVINSICTKFTDASILEGHFDPAFIFDLLPKVNEDDTND